MELSQFEKDLITLFRAQTNNYKRENLAVILSTFSSNIAPKQFRTNEQGHMVIPAGFFTNPEEIERMNSGMGKVMDGGVELLTAPGLKEIWDKPHPDGRLWEYTVSVLYR